MFAKFGTLRPRPHQARLSWFFVLLSFGGVATADTYEEAATLDCGINALVVLSHLAGQPLTFDRLESMLPASRHPEGCSMAELAAASGALGLPLEGVLFGKGDVPLSRPAIAFFQDGKAGHFAVLRPVGTTGTLVQVINPPLRRGLSITTKLLQPTPGRAES